MGGGTRPVLKSVTRRPFSPPVGSTSGSFSWPPVVRVYRPHLAITQSNLALPAGCGCADGPTCRRHEFHPSRGQSRVISRQTSRDGPPRNAYDVRPHDASQPITGKGLTVRSMRFGRVSILLKNHQQSLSPADPGLTPHRFQIVSLHPRRPTRLPTLFGDCPASVQTLHGLPTTINGTRADGRTTAPRANSCVSD